MLNVRRLLIKQSKSLIQQPPFFMQMGGIWLCVISGNGSTIDIIV